METKKIYYRSVPHAIEMHRNSFPRYKWLFKKQILVIICIHAEAALSLKGGGDTLPPSGLF